MSFDKIFIDVEALSIYKGLAFEQALFLALCSPSKYLAKDPIKEPVAGVTSAILAKHKLSFIASNPFSLLYIWRSLPAVVMGRNQNPLKESNLLFLKEHGIALARRDSGGGTVYQDSNNLNFCIISINRDSIKDNLQLMLRTLHNLGFACSIDHNNNIRLGADKISGSAYRYKNNVQLHHFTLLLSPNLEVLRQALRPKNNFILHSKGVESKCTTVTRVPVDFGQVTDCLLQECNIAKEGIEYVSISSSIPSTTNTTYGDASKKSNIFVNSIFTTRLQKEHERLQTYTWIYGRSPNFTIEIERNSSSYLLEVLRGNVIAIYRVSNTADRTKTVVWKGQEEFFSKIVQYNSKGIKYASLNAIIEDIIHTKGE